MAATHDVRRNVTPVRVVSVRDGMRSERADTLATEEPLEIRAQGPGQEAQRVAVTMRTPGGDFELAAGFLFTEGLIEAEDLRRVAYCDDVDDEDQRYNVVTVTLGAPFDGSLLSRNFYATSSCGVCGKASLDDIVVRCDVVPAGFTVAADVVVTLPDRLRTAQRVFDRTGGLHAAGLFTAGGEAISVREDVGRHNAVDKIAGWIYRHNVDPADKILYTTGRLTSEMVIKTVRMGIPILVSRSGFTAWGVDLARQVGLTLVGRARGKRFIALSGEERIVYDQNLDYVEEESMRHKRKGETDND
jgi:FdhD protein